MVKIMKLITEKVENIFENGQKCWLPSFSLFQKMFSKASFLGVIESHHNCVVKSLTKGIIFYMLGNNMEKGKKADQ